MSDPSLFSELMTHTITWSLTKRWKPLQLPAYSLDVLRLCAPSQGVPSDAEKRTLVCCDWGAHPRLRHDSPTLFSCYPDQPIVGIGDAGILDSHPSPVEEQILLGLVDCDISKPDHLVQAVLI